MTEYIAYARKAVEAGILSAIVVVLGWNIPGWIDGSESFEWRSILAGVVGGFLVGLRTYWAANDPQELKITFTKED